MAGIPSLHDSVRAETADSLLDPPVRHKASCQEGCVICSREDEPEENAFKEELRGTEKAFRSAYPLYLRYPEASAIMLDMVDLSLFILTLQLLSVLLTTKLQYLHIAKTLNALAYCEVALFFTRYVVYSLSVFSRSRECSFKTAIRLMALLAPFFFTFLLIVSALYLHAVEDDLKVQLSNLLSLLGSTPSKVFISLSYSLSNTVLSVFIASLYALNALLIGSDIPEEPSTLQKATVIFFFFLITEIVLFLITFTSHIGFMEPLNLLLRRSDTATIHSFFRRESSAMFFSASFVLAWRILSHILRKNLHKRAFSQEATADKKITLLFIIFAVLNLLAISVSLVLLLCTLYATDSFISVAHALVRYKV